MKKNNYELVFIFKQIWRSKLLMTMRWTLFFVVFCMVQVFASNSYSQNSGLSLDLSNVSVKDVLKQIEDRSEFYFIYDATMVDVDRIVSIKSENRDVSEVLDMIFANTDVVYKIKDRRIAFSTSSAETTAVQQRKISGKVTSASGEALPGVTVFIKGTSTGTITDAEGTFTIADVKVGSTVMFSFVGMETQEVIVGKQNNFNIVLKENAIGLEEVVAIGYGSVRKRDLTGSVASVTSATMKDIPVTSAAQAIVGRMPGVQVTQTEGSPDAEIKIRVRGGGSITQDNSPLYVVDGFPVDEIGDIAPTDIESIDVLKDASSTAIYGARGANGVILITTKGGKEGKGKISYNTYFGAKKITKTLDVLDPYEYVLWQYELQPNGGLEDKFGDFNDYQLYKQIDGVDWQNEVFGRTGTSMYHNLSFTGGSKTTKYNISLTHNNEKEIMLGSGYKRTNLTAKLFQKINDWLTLDFNARMSDYRLKGAGTSNNSRLAHSVQYRPLNGLSDFVDDDLVTGDEFDIETSYSINPVNLTNDDYKRRNKLNFSLNGAATIQFTKDLTYRFSYGVNYGSDDRNTFYGINTSNAIKYGQQPLANIQKIDKRSYRMANVLTYKKRDFLPGSNITAMIGEELNYAKNTYLISSAKYFPRYIDPVSALSMMNLGLADPILTRDNPDIKTSSFFGRLNYDYKSKYLFSATFRADGSSKFAPGNQWGYFPSAAVAWRVSDEKFLDFTEAWMSDLKLRVSYGEAGNNRIQDDAWKKTASVSTGGLFLGGNETTPTPFLIPNSILSNPELKWETTITRNIGLDFGLLNQRINGSIEVYKNTTKDLLISASIPANTGYTTQWQNIGQTSNKGLEAALSANIIEKRDFHLSMSFNIGFNRNHIDKLGETKHWEQSASWAGADGPKGDYLIEEGGEIGLMYGFETEGMYSVDDFEYDAETQTYTLLEGVSDNSELIRPVRFGPGMLKLKDQNDDGVVTATDDKVVIGNANPKHTGGFNLACDYKGIDFSVFFNWVYGNDIYNANKLAFTAFQSSRYYKNLIGIMNSDNRFSYIDKTTGEEVFDPERLAAMNQNATLWTPAMSIVTLHSWAIEDGSFLRLNNLTVGYTFPRSIISKIGIEKLRVYATGYNLWIWTNYSGYDPEVDTKRSTPLTPGVDWSAYPRSRSFNVGLNLTF